MHLVIVGGGIAGISCVEELLSLADTEPEQPHPPSSSSPLSITIISPSPLLKRATNIRQHHSIASTRTTFDVSAASASEVLSSLSSSSVAVSFLQAAVTALDTVAHTVSLCPVSSAPSSSSSSASSCPAFLHYDRLLLACGAVPAVPFQGSRVHCIRDTESIQSLSARLQQSRAETGCVMILGNGGIAMEVVAALSSPSSAIGSERVVWVVKDAYMGNTLLDVEASAFLLPQLFPQHDPALDERRYGEEDGRRMKTGASTSRQRQAETEAAEEAEGTAEAEQSSRVFGGALGPHWQQRLQLGDAATSLPSSSAALTVHFNTIVSACCDAAPSPSSTSASSPPLLSVSLSNGRTYSCSLFISATGVTPNTSFVSSSSLALHPSDGGIVTSASSLRTSAPDVFAAGDCTHTVYPHSPHYLQHRLWQQARTMAMRAAQAMYQTAEEELQQQAEEESGWYGVFVHETRLFGLRVYLLGLWNEEVWERKRKEGVEAAADSEQQRRHHEQRQCRALMRVRPLDAAAGGGSYVKVVMEGGRVMGATLIGDTELEETLENLIVNQLDMSAYGDDWLHADVDLADYFD